MARHVALVLTLLSFLATSGCIFSPQLAIVNRDTGSNAITLYCRQPQPGGSHEPIPAPRFFVDDTTRDLVTLLAERDMDYSSGTTGQIEFGLTPEMEGEYLCGPNSSFVSDPVRLLLYPTRDAVQRYYARSEGDTLSLKCGVREGALSSFYTVSWFKGFQSLDISNTRFSLQQVIGTDYTLTINELMKEDAGSYSCEVSVNFGSGNRYSVENTFIQVLVYALPSISLPLTKTTLSLTTQQSISFSCEAHGTPNLTVSWFHNHTPILQTSGRTLNTKYSINSSATADQNSILSVLSITEELGLIDSGEVRCVFGISFLDDDRVMQTPNDESSASLTVLDGTFTMVTIVTQSGDLQPQLTLPAPLPSLTSLVLRYSPADSSFPYAHARDQPFLESAYFNASRIYHFVPNSFLPDGISRFKLQAALMADGMMGPFSPADVSEAPVIDINSPSTSESCDKISEKAIIAIATTVSFVILSIALLSFVCIIYGVNRRAKIKKFKRVNVTQGTYANTLTDGNLGSDERAVVLQMMKDNSQTIGKMAEDSGEVEEGEGRGEGGGEGGGGEEGKREGGGEGGGGREEGRGKREEEVEEGVVGERREK